MLHPCYRDTDDAAGHVTLRIAAATGGGEVGSCTAFALGAGFFGNSTFVFRTLPNARSTTRLRLICQSGVPDWLASWRVEIDAHPLMS